MTEPLRRPERVKLGELSLYSYVVMLVASNDAVAGSPTWRPEVALAAAAELLTGLAVAWLLRKDLDLVGKALLGCAIACAALAISFLYLLPATVYLR